MIIFSVEQSHLIGSVNLRNILEVEAQAESQGVKLTRLEGCYKGCEEQSFITDDVDFAREMAKKYGQETYLERGHYGIWYLIDTAFNTPILAYDKVVEVSREQAYKEDNYTIFNNKYYVGINPRAL